MHYFWTAPRVYIYIYIYIYVCVCVCMCVALVTQHAKRMRRILSSSLAYLAALYISALSRTRHHLRENMLLNIKFVFRLSLHFLPEKFLMLRSNERNVIKNVLFSSRKERFILVRF